MIVFDKAFLNGRFYSMRGEGETFEAMLVHDGKILATGNNEEIRQYPVRESIDLEGRAVLPGMIDTHCQIPEMVDDGRKVDLKSARSFADVRKLLGEGLRKLGTGKWLIGRGLSSMLLAENAFPDRYELDKVTAEVPIYITSFDGHSLMGNSALLKAVGIDSSYIPASGEFVEFDGNHEPTGIFKEIAMAKRILDYCPPLYSDDAECKDAIESYLRHYTGLGYTTVHSVFGNRPSQLLRADLYEELEREHRLPLRINMNWRNQYENGMHLITGLGSDRLKLGPSKFFSDGAMSECTAYLSKEYVDRPGTRGSLQQPEEEFRASVKRAYELGNNVCIHIIGDAALDVVMDLIEEIMDPERPNRFELLHCAVTRPDQLERLKKLPVLVEKQPIFIQAPNTIHGEKRLGTLNPYYHSLKSFFDAGIRVAGGTDGPLSDMNPFMGIQCAVTRKSKDGSVTINPQERISVYEAVQMFTVNGSYANFEEHLKGTLEPGKLADFIVTERDIFESPVDEIGKIKVLAAYVGGEATF